MVTLFGTSLAASAPWFLAGIPLATALLVYIFRAKGRGARLTVPTLFLLRQLPEHLPARRRFVPPLQFWIELLGLTLLSLAAAGLVLSDRGKRVAIVIDTSKSMATVQPSGETRLAAATRLAASEITGTITPTRYTVFSAVDALSRASSEHTTAREALSSLNALTQSHGEDRLASGVASLLSSGSYDSIWIFTDKIIQGDTATLPIRFTTIPSEPSTTPNVWIRSLAARATPQGDTLDLTLSLAGPREVAVIANATCTHGAEQFDLPATRLALTPATPAEVTLGLLKRPWSFCRVSLSPQGENMSDTLSLDNEGWIANTAQSDLVLLKSPLSPAELGLTGISRLAITTDDSLADARDTIFHRQAPPTVPSRPSLVVLPPLGSLPWKGGRALAPSAQRVEITRWSETHPILQYVQPTLIALPSATVLECPESATPIIFSAHGPLMCAGEEGGVRYVVTGFELFPFDGLRTPTVSILTLNLVKWLFQSGSRATTNDSLSSFTVPMGATEAREIAPAPRAFDLAQSRSLTISRPSVLSLTADRATSFVAFNAFSDAESDTSHSATLPLPQHTATTTARTPTATPLQTALAIAALLVLLADIVRRILRRSRWGAV